MPQATAKLWKSSGNFGSNVLAAPAPNPKSFNITCAAIWKPQTGPVSLTTAACGEFGPAMYAMG
jgi:hypothetical protein